MAAVTVPAASRFLRSACCDAAVIQCRELDTELWPVLCTQCGGELGAPGVEDFDPRPVTPFDQWGCQGRHNGIGTPDCPRELHHHHDRRCQPPAFVQIEATRGGESSGGSSAGQPHRGR